MSLDQTSTLLSSGHDLSLEESRALFDAIFSGEASETQIGEILLALHNKGETLSEIQGATASMRANMLPIHAPEEAIDIVGTGGDGHGTLNVSTAAAFVAAGAGAVVAKHGNRAASSLSGSSDVLTKLNINLDAPFDRIERGLNDIGIGFLFAPRHHFAMRFVAPVRKKLGVRTIFNLLGPLTNPANVAYHLIGLFDDQWARPMAETLASLGSKAAWITHGQDGLDELSTTGPSSVTSLKNGEVESFDVSPQTFDLPLAELADLRGGDAEVNAAALLRLLDGEEGPYRDIVVMNAAAALLVTGKAFSAKDAARLAAASIDTGAAKEKLTKLVEVTHG